VKTPGRAAVAPHGVDHLCESPQKVTFAASVTDGIGRCGVTGRCKPSGRKK
jgi:hypothetical protein